MARGNALVIRVVLELMVRDRALSAARPRLDAHPGGDPDDQLTTAPASRWPRRKYCIERAAQLKNGCSAHAQRAVWLSQKKKTFQISQGTVAACRRGALARLWRSRRRVAPVAASGSHLQGAGWTAFDD